MATLAHVALDESIVHFDVSAKPEMVAGLVQIGAPMNLMKITS